MAQEKKQNSAVEKVAELEKAAHDDKYGPSDVPEIGKRKRGRPKLVGRSPFKDEKGKWIAKTKRKFYKPFGNPDAIPRSTTKDRKVDLPFPREDWILVKEKAFGMNLKMQALWDILMVQGLVYRTPIVLEMIERYAPKYHKAQCELNKLVIERQPFKDHWFWQMNNGRKAEPRFFLFSHDYLAIRHFSTDKRIAVRHIIWALFIDAFLSNDPDFDKFIKEAQSSRSFKKKKVIQRLVRDDYISALSVVESEKLLEQLTLEYDESIKPLEATPPSIVDDLILSEIEKENDELDKQLLSRQKEIKEKRNKIIKATLPEPENELEDEDDDI